MNILLYTIRKKFSGVQHVSTDTVYGWLVPRPRADLLLLDTRTAAEFGVSRLPGAVHLDPDSDDATVRRTLTRHLPPAAAGAERERTTIACYCSVGYRSSVTAQRLNALRAQPAAAEPPLPAYEAVNIEGSIFKWANEGKPLEGADGQPTRLVHPYDKIFGRLLDKSLWKFPEKQ
ncbi:hypothetical protein FJT64_024565 [Amphibalanus amphitrite]|uniref:Rhodanese domain-containing protein n=1 Tax=Amphibalanus amphitrite TaxID=1232801 RepID=A0A6A4W6M5_AMPAM|nr:hypothetical protein FJT64_024565 [Amphibalanus amphitrite]